MKTLALILLVLLLMQLAPSDVENQANNPDVTTTLAGEASK